MSIQMNFSQKTNIVFFIHDLLPLLVCTYIDAIFSKIFPIFEIFYHFFYSLTLRTHSARVRCAGFLMSLLGTSQEVTKKDAKPFPLGSPFPCRATMHIKR